MEQALVKELDALLLALAEESLSAEQGARLETLVLAHDAAARRYLDHVHLVGELRWRNGAARDGIARAVESPSPAESADRWWHVAYDWFIQPMSLSVIVAALFCTSFVLGMALLTMPALETGRGSDDTAVTFVAELVDTRQAAWSDESDVNFKYRWMLAGDTLILNSGFAEVAFGDGASVLLEGPCRLVAIHSNEANLVEGKLVATVSSAAIGFIVETPSARIIDLGTEFGVAADRVEGTAVKVFQGVVSVSPARRAQQPPPPQLLRAGEALRIDIGGQQVVSQASEHDPFVRKLSDVRDPRADAVQAYRDQVLADQPIAFWMLREKRGIVAEDSAGGLIGAYQGNVLRIRDGWDAARFDGTTGRMEVPFHKSLNPQGDFSVEAWVRVREPVPGFQSVVTSRNDAPGEQRAGYMLYAGSSNKWEFWLDGDQPEWSKLQGGNITPGVWTHLVGVYDGARGTMILYVDGERTAQSEVSGYKPNAKNALSIGAGGDASTQYHFHGDIAAVAVYQRAIAPERVTQHFNLGRAFAPNVKPWTVPTR